MPRRLRNLLERALELKQRQDFLGALKVLSTVVEEYPDCAPAHGLMGGIYYHELERLVDAVACFRRATRLSPRSEAASLGLFHALWDSGRRDKAVAEMKRFRSVARSADYEKIAAELKAKSLLP